MKFDRDDFSRLRLSLAAALAMAAVGAACAWIADGYAGSARRELAQARAQRAEYEQKLRQVRQEENEIKAKSALYADWRARGIIGPEQRLDWVEMIRDIRAQRQLLDIQYEFAPQQPLGPPSGGYGFRSSSMKLQMKLLHEGDLLNFVRDLRREAHAYVRVRSCNLTRLPRGGAGETALLQADCTLEWITIEPPKEHS